MAEKGAEKRESFIRVRGLEKSFGAQQIHRGVDLDLYKGETVVVIGASGEGKSVLLKQILGLTTPDAGRVEIEGNDIAQMGEREISRYRKQIGILFQHGALFDSMTVGENVAFPLRQAGEKDQSKIADRVHHCLSVVELAEHLEKMPVNLSGGMRKRVALARAMAPGPQCILYDEPTAGLDPVVSDSINHLIRRLQAKFGMTSLVVTHDMKSAYHVADRIIYLRGGKVYFTGTVEEVQNSPDIVIQNFVNGHCEETRAQAAQERSTEEQSESQKLAENHG